jgi:DNA helicase HerA-like ATPase
MTGDTKPPDKSPLDDEYRKDILARAGWSVDALKAAYAEARVTNLEFTERLLLRHVLILGTTGAGKTTDACHVIRSALKRAPQARCFIVDVKKEYRRLAETLNVPTRIMAIGDEPRGMDRSNAVLHLPNLRTAISSCAG